MSRVSLSSSFALRVAICALGCLGRLTGSAVADSMSVPSVELREEESGRYVLEVTIVPAQLSAIRSPEPPSRCEIGESKRSDGEGSIRLSYAIECAHAPLEPADVIVLPWRVDGIQLTVHWEHGAEHRALVGREPAGVVIRCHLVMARPDGFADLVKEHVAAGWSHFWTGWSHPLFAIALGLFGWAGRIGFLGFLAGHVFALVVADLGIVGLPPEPVDAILAGGTALLLAGFLRTGAVPRGLFVTTWILGSLHGMGTATELVREGVPSSMLVKALFLSNSGLDIGSLSVGAIALALVMLGRALFERRRSAVVGVLGTFSVVALLSGMTQSLSPRGPSSSAASFVNVEARRSRPLLTAADASSSAAGEPQTQVDASGKLLQPFSSFVVVEPYQIRHEVLVDVPSLIDWLEVPTDAAANIPVEAQRPLTEAIAALVTENNPLIVDGVPAVAESRRADFVVIGLEGALTRLTPVPEPLNQASVGVTLVYETDHFAESVVLEWGLFSAKVSAVPLTVTDAASAVATELTPSESRFEWRHTLGALELPAVEAIDAPETRVPLASLALALVALVFLTRSTRRGFGLFVAVAAYMIYPFERVEASVPFIGPRIDRVEAADVVEGLLTNVYRSFDIHNEELIYDRLALTVTGDQLLDVYLESRRALELENRGGARVRIHEVVVQQVDAVRRVADGGFELDAQWIVGGSVNHFGHVHFRQNRYDATLAIIPVDGTWKIRGLELLEEKRLL